MESADRMLDVVSHSPHPQWLYRRGVDQAVLVDRELLIRPAPQRTTLGHALNLLAGAAMRFRDCFGSSDPASSLIGFFAHRQLLTGRAPASTDPEGFNEPADHRQGSKKATGSVSGRPTEQPH